LLQGVQAGFFATIKGLPPPWKYFNMSGGTTEEPTGVVCHIAVDSGGAAPAPASPCLAIILHPLRPARVSQAVCLLAELGLIEAHCLPARRRKRARLPRNPFAISEELLLHIASFVGDAATLRALSATNKQIDTVLCRSPAGALIWNRLLMAHFSLDARSLMRSKARQPETAELRRAGASTPAAGGSRGAAPSSSNSSSRAAHRSSASLRTAGAGSGRDSGVTADADDCTAASHGDCAAHAPAAPAAPALPPCCVPKLLYESLERTRRDVSRAAQATAEAQRLQRLGRVDASMWHGLMDATGLARFAPEPPRPAAPRWGANGWFNFGGASWYGSR